MSFGLPPLHHSTRRGLLLSAVVATLAASTLLAPTVADAATSDWIDPAYTAYTSPAVGRSEFHTAPDASGGLLVFRAGTTDAPNATVTRLLPNGGRDTAYGSGGVSPALAGSEFGAIAADGTGALVLAADSTNGNVLLRRLTAAGAVDTTFGTGGAVAVVSDSDAGVAAVDVARRSDGSSVVSIVTFTIDQTESTYSSTLYAFTASGGPVTTFGTGGSKALPGVYASDIEAWGATVATHTVAEDGSERITRYLTSGALDTTFNGTGSVSLPADTAINAVRFIGGAYVLVGSVGTDEAYQPAVRRLGTDGRWDTTFSADGLAVVAPTACSTGAYDVAAGDGGSLHLTGISTNCGNGEYWTSPLYLYRFSSSGVLDTSFGSDGTLKIDSYNGADVVYAALNSRPTGGVLATLETALDAEGSSLRSSTVALAASGLATPGAFVPVSPARILDTRAANGVTTTTPLRGGEELVLQVTGRGGVPAQGAASVVLNVTAVDPTRSGYVTVWPEGTPRPTASNINVTAGQVTPNQVTVTLGTNGRIRLLPTLGGTTHLIADVAGYYRSGTPTAAGAFTPTAPTRILDSRVGNGTSAPGPVAGATTIDVQVSGRAGVPATASAVVFNLTAVAPARSGYVTAWPTGQAMPTASNLNVTAGQNRANLATVKLGQNGRISLRNQSGGPLDLLADVAGYYLGGTPTLGGTFVALDPQRVLDTRNGTGKPYQVIADQGAFPVRGAVQGTTTFALPLAGQGGLPSTGVGAVVLNTTVTAATRPGRVTVYPFTENLPLASNLNFAAGQTVPNLVTVKTGARTTVSLQVVSSGSTHVIADLAGYFRD